MMIHLETHHQMVFFLSIIPKEQHHTCEKKLLKNRLDLSKSKVKVRSGKSFYKAQPGMQAQ